MRRQDFEHRPTLIRADEPVGRALPLDQAADQHALCGPYRDDLPPIGVGGNAEQQNPLRGREARGNHVGGWGLGHRWCRPAWLQAGRPLYNCSRPICPRWVKPKPPRYLSARSENSTLGRFTRVFAPDSIEERCHRPRRFEVMDALGRSHVDDELPVLGRHEPTV